MERMKLTGIRDDNYSTVDACTTTRDMWVAIERLQQEVNEIRAEKIGRNANPLALIVATQQHPDTYYKAPKSHKSYAPTSKQSSSTISHATTRNKDMQKNLALTAKYFKKSYKPTNNNLITSSNTRNKSVDTSPIYMNENQTWQFGNQRTVTVAGTRETVGSQETKKAKDYTYHKEKMLLCKQAEKGVSLCTEQTDWLDDTDEKLEAHYSFMAKTQEVDSNVIPDSSGICANDNQTDQNAKECDDKRAMLANLIANLKLKTNENKRIKKQLKKVNASLAQEIKECKSILDEFNRTRDLVALHDKEIELEKYKRYHDCTIENDKLERKLKETLGLLA
ncbi:hypothetical protein Tco_0269499 [Tanacetum coccineum]